MLCETMPAADCGVRTASAPKEHAAERVCSETIVVAEDDDLVLELVCHVLTDSGYEVVRAKDPRECIDKVLKHPGRVHLLLTDVVMPMMGGHELHHRLCETRSPLKVLWMSGYSDQVIADHGVDADHRHVLYKPFSVQTLLAKVREVLDR